MLHNYTYKRRISNFVYKIKERNALAIDSDRFYWLQSDRINATRPRIGGIRKWEMTSAGRIDVIAEVI